MKRRPASAGGDEPQPGVSSRFAVMAGFGGLLILMAVSQIDAVQALRQMQQTNNRVRQGYLLRTRVLDRIRSDLYISGAYIRDYLLEPRTEMVDRRRRGLVEIRRDMEGAIGQYQAFVNQRESSAFGSLKQALVAYWGSLEPVVLWSATQRAAGGYAFLRDAVVPRRAAVLGIADQVRALNEAQLTAGGQKVEQAFTRFRNRLFISIVLTVGLGLVLASFSMRKIFQLESAAAERYRDSLRMRLELQQLSAGLVDVQEEERRTISRGLHEEVGQSLMAVLVEMANLSTLASAVQSKAISRKADEIKGLVEDSVSAVRNMALLLRPSMLDDFGVGPALEWQARETSRRSGISVSVSADVAEDLPEEYRTCIYRVVQEAFRNCVLHSGAKRVRISVRQEPERLLLSVRDDGRGFDARRERGLGLLAMRERVLRLGGEFVIDSEPGQGAAVRVSIPTAFAEGSEALKSA